MAVVEFKRDVTERQYQFHSIADIFPLLEGAEFQKLVDSIAENGLLEPILLYENKILDGRNRALACEQAGVSLQTREFTGTSAEAVSYVWALNRARRHLNSSQAAIADAKRARLLDVYAPIRAVAAARKDQVSKLKRNDLGQVLARPDSQLIDSVGNDRNINKTDTKRAEAAGTNRQYINIADRIIEEHPEYVAKIESGEKTLTQVQRELKEQQRQAARAAIAEQVKHANIASLIGQNAFSAIVIDPPWDWGDEGDKDQLGRAKPTYATIGIDEIEAMPVGQLAAKDAHIYLWITNRSLPKGFRLLDAWGFRYITALTWVKPSFGMGNYFRGQTEHILFGIRGSLSLLRKDVGTVFHAARGKGGHSSKPIESYELVESCSPGPYLEIFARTERKGWRSWGGEL